MGKIIKLNEGELNKLVKRVISEIYSDEDIMRGEELGKSKFGVDIKFKGDFRQNKLIIKKLVRLKSKLDDIRLKKEIDDILDMLETAL